MKTLRNNRGQFVERPYYTDAEIERTCSEELRAVDLLPAKPEPIRIDRFIEKRFGVAVDYDDLPDGVLGYTRFGQKGVTGIVVARVLEEEGGVPNQRRVRSTLAHEAGHGLFHSHLFVLAGGQSTLFPDGTGAAPKVLCRGDGVGQTGKRYKGEWWEFHANAAIGALLLPRELVPRAVEQFLESRGTMGLRTLPANLRGEAAKRLSDVFDVNPVVAAIRLNQVFPQLQDVQQVL